MTAPRSWIVGQPQNVTAEVYHWWGNYSVTISLLSYPDKNVTFDSKELILTNDNRHKGNIALLVKTEDLPSGKMEKFAYLVVKFLHSSIEVEVLLTEQPGNCTYYSKRYQDYQSELEMHITALEDLEFDENIWRDVDSQVESDSWIDLDVGDTPFFVNLPVQDKIESKTKAWINLQSNTEAWRDLESRNRAWTDLQSNMTALGM
ncbi:uncharacterized protein [Hyperolius riggenbachi]|uniref:uncharacterized protein n=1 Tax=Hyperolius riggenbachi TaxID=752182 RepID=UPI0035A274FC